MAAYWAHASPRWFFITEKKKVAFDAKAVGAVGFMVVQGVPWGESSSNAELMLSSLFT